MTQSKLQSDIPQACCSHILHLQGEATFDRTFWTDVITLTQPKVTSLKAESDADDDDEDDGEDGWREDRYKEESFGDPNDEIFSSLHYRLAVRALPICAAHT